MKAFGKLLGEFIAWRWFPAVGLCIASLFYVLVVVALVPDEIGVPVTNARFAKKVAPAGDEKPELSTYPTAMPESEPAPSQPVAQIQPAGVVDFGRRGFTPPLERPEAPPPPPPPPPPVMMPPVVAPPPVETPAAEAAVMQPAPALPAGTDVVTAPASPSTVPPGVVGRAMQAFRGQFPRNVPHNLPSQPPAAPQPPEEAPAPTPPPMP